MKENTKDKIGYDVVFSNPPYQVMDEGHGASAGPIYNKIIEYVIDVLQPHYISMITPSRWMAGGKGLNVFRARMLQDKRLKLIQDFPATHDVFKNVIIKGGVSYFLWDKDYEGLCEFNGHERNISEFNIIVRDTTAHQILKKVLSKALLFCDERVLPSPPFGLNTNFKEWVIEGTQGAVKCYSRGKVVNWTNEVLDPNKVLALWKVCTSKGINPNSEGRFEVYNQLFIAEPVSICTQTYIITGSFKTKKEAENYAAYMRTRFYRFMLSLRVVSQDLYKSKFSWVPDLQNYSKAWTDQELYQHFGLTKKEVAHIETSIKSLD